MEKITASQFGKFDGFGISNLREVKGGDGRTGGGASGSAAQGYSVWDSDYMSGTVLRIGTVYYMTNDQFMEKQAGNQC